MSDLGTRSRKGMRDGISSPKECPERTWEQELGDSRRQTQLRNVGSVRQTYGEGGVDWNGGSRGLSEPGLEIWRENSQFHTAELKLFVPKDFILTASSHPSS